MSYDEYRLWKHNQKRSKKIKEMEKKRFAEEDDEEPEFMTYSEYKQWKAEQRTKEEKQTTGRLTPRFSTPTEKETSDRSKDTRKKIPEDLEDKFQHPKEYYKHKAHEE